MSFGEVNHERHESTRKVTFKCGGTGYYLGQYPVDIILPIPSRSSGKNKKHYRKDAKDAKGSLRGSAAPREDHSRNFPIPTSRSFGLFAP